MLSPLICAYANCISRFSNVKSFSYSWDKPSLVILYSLNIHCWLLIVHILFKTFTTTFIEEIRWAYTFLSHFWYHRIDRTFFLGKVYITLE